MNFSKTLFAIFFLVSYALLTNNTLGQVSQPNGFARNYACALNSAIPISPVILIHLSHEEK